MKSTRDFRTTQDSAADTIKKAVKLEPIRKSGKERHSIYKAAYQEEDDEELELKALRKKESVLDYMGDEDEEEEFDDDFEDEFDEEFEDEEEFDEEFEDEEEEDKR